jgi:predicted nuclease of restriction endonuclease-like (RecB) superfamily
MGKHAVRSEFTALLADVRGRIQVAQTRAVLAVNAELVRLYWDIGRIIHARQKQKGWGAGVIPRLARALKKELPELKGFSERNIGRMIAFYRQYSQPTEFLPLAVAKLRSPKGLQTTTAPSEYASLWSIPWAHHVILMDKVAELAARRWYMEQALTNGWSRDSLALQIESRAYARSGKVVSNFSLQLPAPQSELAQQALKDPYVFDFLTLAEPFRERELETELVRHVQSFLLELGQGFAFVGRQYRLDVGDDNFYIDLLFYHLRLRAFVVIDLKKGNFKPEYAGKLNFYCNVVNDLLKHANDAPTIGLILCQTRDHLLAEYSFAGIDKPIGISTYELTRALPTQMQSALPTVEDIEAELLEASKGTVKIRRRKS